MSSFLYEGSDQAEQEETLEDAIQRADKVLTELEKVGKDFPSAAVSTAVKGIRDNLTKVSTTKKSGKWTDWFGKSSTTISQIADNLTDMVAAVKTASERVKAAVDTSKVNVEINKDKSLKKLVNSGKIKGFKNVAELQKILTKATTGGIRTLHKRLGSKLKSIFKGAGVVDFDAEQFAIDIMDAKIGAVLAYLGSPVGNADPAEVAPALAPPTIMPSVAPSDAPTAPPAGGPASTQKISLSDLTAHLSSEQIGIPADQVAAVINAVKGILSQNGVTTEGHRIRTTHSLIHRQNLAKLLFEEDIREEITGRIDEKGKRRGGRGRGRSRPTPSRGGRPPAPAAAPATPATGLKFQDIVGKLKGQQIGGSEYSEENAIKAAAAIAKFIKDKTGRAIEGAPNTSGGGARTPIPRAAWPAGMELPKDIKNNAGRLNKMAIYVNDKAGIKVLENKHDQDRVILERWSKLAGLKERK